MERPVPGLNASHHAERPVDDAAAAPPGGDGLVGQHRGRVLGVIPAEGRAGAHLLQPGAHRLAHFFGHQLRVLALVAPQDSGGILQRRRALREAGPPPVQEGCVRALDNAE